MGLYNTIKSKLKKYGRVIRITQKPDKDEFMMSAKVTGVGILIIGLIGFLIYMIGITLIP